jgi:3-hydroxyethyl bacteriochlorophyllide a dehydrogenase
MLLSRAVVFEAPHRLSVRSLPSPAPRAGEVRVQIERSGISTGTERLLFSGEMPPFPGLGYPLVPGYESVGVVVAVGDDVLSLAIGDRVFVPGGGQFEGARSLFGGTASALTVQASRAHKIPGTVGDEGVLLALLATAHHAVVSDGVPRGDLIIGHGVLGRLAARLLASLGRDVVVWEHDERRLGGARGYRVMKPSDDPRRDYGCIIDISGDSGIMDVAIARLAKGGELVLAGFYKAPLSFSFPPAFMREIRMRVAAEWTETDLHAAITLLERGAIELSDLVTHRFSDVEAARAYDTAFGDVTCLKAVIAWDHAAGATS